MRRGILDAWRWVSGLFWSLFVVLAFVWLALFAVNMIMKEASMSRYAGWAEYKKSSGWLLPPLL